LLVLQTGVPGEGVNSSCNLGNAASATAAPRSQTPTPPAPPAEIRFIGYTAWRKRCDREVFFGGTVLFPAELPAIDCRPTADMTPMTLWKPGFDEWERKVMLTPRTLSVVTGHPDHGKTSRQWS
jgi:hypothetical protein